MLIPLASILISILTFQSTVIASRYIGRTLPTGRKMHLGDCLYSEKATHKVCFQPDSNLVLYDSNQQSIWQSNTADRDATRLVLEPDNNLVMYNSTSGGRVIWSSGSGNRGAIPGRIVVQDDGDLVIIGWDEKTVWSSKRGNVAELNKEKSSLQNGECLKLDEPGLSSPTGLYRAYYKLVDNYSVLAIQKTNELDYSDYIYTKPADDKSSTICLKGTELILKHSSGSILWSTVTEYHGKSPARLFMQDDGNLILYDTNSDPIWSSKHRSLPISPLGNILPMHTIMNPGDFLLSADGAFKAQLEQRGTFSIYDVVKGHIFDGIAPAGTALWRPQSNKYLLSDNVQLLLANGTFELSGTIDKATLKIPVKSYEGADSALLIMQNDGNLVLYAGRRPVWASKGFKDAECECTSKE